MTIQHYFNDSLGDNGNIACVQHNYSKDEICFNYYSSTPERKFIYAVAIFRIRPKTQVDIDRWDLINNNS